jgi:hypothetical protein
MLSPPYKRSRWLRHAQDGQQGERRDNQAVGDTLRGLRAHVTATAVGIDPVERHLDKPIELLGTVHTVDDFESGGQVGLVNGLGQLVIFARVLSALGSAACSKITTRLRYSQYRRNRNRVQKCSRFNAR